MPRSRRCVTLCGGSDRRPRSEPLDQPPLALFWHHGRIAAGAPGRRYHRHRALSVGRQRGADSRIHRWWMQHSLLFRQPIAQRVAALGTLRIVRSDHLRWRLGCAGRCEWMMRVLRCGWLRVLRGGNARESRTSEHANKKTGSSGHDPSWVGHEGQSDDNARDGAMFRASRKCAKS